jgi:cell division protein FtsI/penicillin-binding protein 2
LPADALADAAPAFGLGVIADLGVPAFWGSVPSVPDAVERAAAAIGQGRVLASPLAMAGVAATVATGQARTPVLLPDVAAAAPPAAAPPPLDPAVAQTLRLLMHEVVQTGSGTALKGLPGGPVGAKTGTAEYGSDAPPRTHAWVIGFRDDVAFAVLVEDGGSGGRAAGPVAAAFLRGLDAAQN